MSVLAAVTQGDQPDVVDQAVVYGGLALRILVALVLGTFALAGSANLYLVLIVVVGVLGMDAGNIFTLKNFTLTYILLVFGVGAAVLHRGKPFIFGDIVAYLLMFLVGYAMASVRSPGRPSTSMPRRTSGRGPLRVSSLRNALVFLIILDLMFLAVQLAKYGVIGYYQGQGLLNQALTFGKSDPAGGAEQILRFGLRDTGIALVIVYIRACFESNMKVTYKYPIAVLVVLPIISLNRFNAVVGALTALAIFACDRRLSARRSRAPAEAGTHRAVPAPAGPTMMRGLLIAAGLVLAIVTALFVAELRSGFTRHGSAHPTSNSTLQILTSELDPVRAYGDIKANIGVLGHPYGRTILLPVLLKVVPRAWYPNKPLNSSAYYMTVVRPAEFNAGLAVPTTFFGDAYLSFGFGGAILLSLALGAMAARFDFGYKHADLRRLPWFLLIFANFYGVLRDSISESMAAIVLMMIVWAIANNLFRPKSATTALSQARVPDPRRGAQST